MDGSLPDSSVHEIFQTRVLEWAAISSPGDLPNTGIKPMTPASPALAGGFFTTEPPGSLKNCLEGLLKLLLLGLTPRVSDWAGFWSGMIIYIGITGAVDVNLGRLQEVVRDGEVWRTAAHGVATTWQLNNSNNQLPADAEAD